MNARVARWFLLPAAASEKVILSSGMRLDHGLMGSWSMDATWRRSLLSYDQQPGSTPVAKELASIITTPYVGNRSPGTLLPD